MAGDSFSVSSPGLAALAAAFVAQADTLSAAIPRWRAGAIDGMAAAWGDMGEETRADYLEGAQAFVPSLEAVVAALRQVAEALERTLEQTRETEAATADLFDAISRRLEGGA